jgi:hypothetical protein
LGSRVASKVKKGKGTLFVDLRKSSFPLSINQNDQVSYLGRFGDVFILYDIDAIPQHLIVMEAYNLKGLVLVPAGKGTKK